VAPVTIPELIGQLQQARRHLDQAKAMVRATLEELGKAEALIQYSLGSSAGPTMQPAARSRQHLTGAGQAMNETTHKIEEWIAKVEGRPIPGK